jgi:hypothetical protein
VTGAEIAIGLSWAKVLLGTLLATAWLISNIGLADTTPDQGCTRRAYAQIVIGVWSKGDDQEYCQSNVENRRDTGFERCASGPKVGRLAHFQCRSRASPPVAARAY